MAVGRAAKTTQRPSGDLRIPFGPASSVRRVRPDARPPRTRSEVVVVARSRQDDALAVRDQAVAATRCVRGDPPGGAGPDPGPDRPPTRTRCVPSGEKIGRVSAADLSSPARPGRRRAGPRARCCLPHPRDHREAVVEAAKRRPRCGRRRKREVAEGPRGDGLSRLKRGKAPARRLQGRASSVPMRRAPRCIRPPPGCGAGPGPSGPRQSAAASGAGSAPADGPPRARAGSSPP